MGFLVQLFTIPYFTLSTLTWEVNIREYLKSSSKTRENISTKTHLMLTRT